MLTATTLALPPRTNIPRPTKKNPKDTPNCVFNKIDWDQINGTDVPYARSNPLFFFIFIFQKLKVSDADSCVF